MHKILILFVFLLVTQQSFGQAHHHPYDVKDLKLWEIKGFAKSAVVQGDYNSAIYYYTYLNKKYPHKTKYLWQLAYQYQKARDYSNAYEAFDKLAEICPKKWKLANYYKAINAKSLGFYEEAYGLLKKIRVRQQKKWMPKYFAMLVESQTKGCELALAMKDSIYQKKLKELPPGINGAHIEFNPFFLSDTVFVYSSVPVDTLKYYTTESDVPKRRFFLAKKQKDKWTGGHRPDPPFFNSKEYDTGDGVFSIDGKRFYFTRCNRNWQNKMICHLYVSEKFKDEWLKPYKLGSEINIPNYSSTEPTVGTCYDPNLEVVYFVSTRPGGYGQTDIWYTIYDLVKQTYQKPVNAGIYLNTSGAEATPFYDRMSHKMYFSSDGWPNFGGLDVFSAQGELVNWDEPVNLGYPINSSCDDLYYAEDELGENGFITSNRGGGLSLTHPYCCDDIYAWKSVFSEKASITGSVIGYTMSLKEVGNWQINDIRNNALGKFVDKAKIDIYVRKDSVNLVYLNSTTTDSVGGFYFSGPIGLDYRLKINDRRVVNKIIDFSTGGVDNKDMDLGRINVTTMDTLPTILHQVFGPGNRTKLTDKEGAVIDTVLLKLMLLYEDVEIEIASHTDTRGNDRYNMRLSSRRANEVVKYLISKGIDAHRLKAVGYGGTRPIAPNKKNDGTDNPKGRALNWRTEFRLIDHL
ncbi:OmpA family protein [Saccharicrinis carchari]|uniref:OmpA family protein n=1 Tax=Saccharicrinis carchari TaxID=1168039 RepID=A0A521AS56_SACCC|nr:OmpA family protein [Saccharicrinis carchari]SMO37615.1 OmpA family protein [Saccharicrinis carchari]